MSLFPSIGEQGDIARFGMFEKEQISDLDFEPACEGQHHAQGSHGHVPEQPAAFLGVLECGHSLLLCKAWVVANLSHTHVACPGCAGHHPNIRNRFIPLPTGTQ